MCTIPFTKTKIEPCRSSPTIDFFGSDIQVEEEEEMGDGEKTKQLPRKLPSLFKSSNH